MSINRATLIGRLGDDIRIKDTPKGKVATFTIATNKRYKDKAGNTQDFTTWHNGVAWNATAELMAKHLKKGSKVYIAGELRNDEWVTDSNEKRTRTYILVEVFENMSVGQMNPEPANPDKRENVQPYQEDLPF